MSKILFRGVEYTHADQMPADVRAEYDKAVQMLPDRDNNGIPDLLESDNAPERPTVPPYPVVSGVTPPLSVLPAKLSRSGKLAAQGLRWIPWVIFGGILLCVGCVFLFMLGIMSLIKSSDAYQLGLKTALASPTAQEVLGTPIQDGMFVSGSVSGEGATGTADLGVSLSGSSHSGNLQIVATKKGDTWQLDSLTLIVGEQE
ncbi:MAG: cytochrome c oxidase assembly factor Coa1 family protein [Saprospiraceae bacterium]|nr:cytochrome c oxidase assembly factor Coa1 family protein [Saprospiraceae bacterium]